VKFLPPNYNLCRLLHASAIQIYDWSMRETPNTAVTAALHANYAFVLENAALPSKSAIHLSD
jgi:hypothetical protein